MSTSEHTHSAGTAEANIEELLSAAGIAFTVVERCPDPGCELCRDGDLSVAA